ncbi:MULTISPECIES: hypothetical protein [Mycobacterium avium complex (MAC)]|uniref:Uncharacterized protein n=4 Tax=Mycobacterium avium complex (MAC) TaxID=120793 RepID=A0A2U2E8V7_MYCAV|nr:MULTISPECIES: hypothetical protein [Mycobacterium avium complex (MAC)]ETA93549.1 hypothetical protein O984_08580 [Mycobacterium avium 05-4293]ETB16873.1 hypothetical protein O983_27150 [Mycobacterium avium 09-5983]ETB23864.1 hypothetical protein O971_25170 [Mycobacterium avium subsp. hominissuis 10-4249]ETB36235.1 hypothetical protein N602_24650 [Mycobacterium avium subsp. hominissuis 10-5606]ETB38923.1 hypothetical protein O974_26560 [Mycobacterium avium 11-0986]TXA39567.1 hypothetical pr
MTAASPPAPATHPRTHSVEFWRSRLGAMASRGETDGPRVDEARAALSWLRRHAFLVRNLDITPERADSLMDLIDQHAEADTETVAR